jgi:hypothetical protein
MNTTVTVEIVESIGILGLRENIILIYFTREKSENGTDYNNLKENC